MTERWVIYTDGACRGNPGPGGWGAVLYRDGGVNELSGAESNTTNNRMELTAPVEALSALPDSSHVSLYTDSQYVKNGITVWISNWKRNGWKTSNGKQVKNQDLWQALDQSTQRHVV
ncbi:MAG TPA: ribonuclease HI, partial [Arenicellales bacterium]|nr:ribonuclease HI [Arenicellales bacterium]